MLERVGDASRIHFSSDVSPLDGIFSKETETNLYRIVQESVNNIVKHSGATKAIEIEQQGNSIVVTVQDNGRGFVPAAAGRAGGGVRSFGLSGIAERVRMLGGNYTVRSQPGQGTTIRMKISICRTVIRALQMKDEIRIVIADDHPVFRRGLRQIKSRRTHG